MGSSSGIKSVICDGVSSVVRSIGGGGQSWEQYWATRTPAYLVAMANSETEIILSWIDAIAASDGLRIYISTDNITYTEKGTAAFGAETYSATGLTTNTLYYFKLVAYKGTNESDPLTATETTLEKWYLSGGIAVANAKGAYSPITKATLALSKVNDVNPGTNDAGGGTDPTHDPALGWVFDGTTQYLKTGIVPVNDQTWSMIVRFTEWTTGGDTLCGLWEGTTLKEFYIQIDSVTNRIICGNGNHSYRNVAINKGIIAVVGNKIYVNGVDSGTTIGGGTGSITYDIWIGQVHYSSDANFFDGNIQALAIYNKVLSATEQLALWYRMRYITDPVNITLMDKYVAQGFGGLICWNMSTFDGNDMAAPDQIATFAPTGFDMDEWLDACVAAGMKYAILTAKHWDGFALWSTAYAVSTYDPYSVAQTTWYAANGNPDVVELFVNGCRSRGLKVGLYFNMNDTTWEARTGQTHATDPVNYLAMIETQLTELLTNYGRIDSLWIDGWGWHVGYVDVPFETIYNFVKGLQPYCVIVENSQTHPAITSQIETYEVPVDSVIPAGNVRKAEEVDSPRKDGAWFAFPLSDQTVTAFDSSATIKAAIAQANARNGTYLLAVTPTIAGVLPAALETILEEIGT